MVNQGGVEMRIAIIEDDEITRLELSKLLNTQGYETVLLTDFGNLTDELKQYSIELVLLDINLPYENGYEVCRKIKQVMPVPIIFVTSRDTNAVSYTHLTLPTSDLPTSDLVEKLWNDKYYLDENVLLVNMTRLKKKMKEIGIVHLVENIRGKGWKL